MGQRTLARVFFGKSLPARDYPSLAQSIISIENLNNFMPQIEMKKSCLFGLIFLVFETLASLRPGPKDPFLVIPQLRCKGRQRIIPDPKYCDRVLICGDSPSIPAIVQYCKSKNCISFLAPKIGRLKVPKNESSYQKSRF